MSTPNSSPFARSETGHYKVSGLLNVDTVGTYKDLGMQALRQARQEGGTSIVFDMSEAEVRGSAVIALMIGWRREAERMDGTLSFANCPANLLAIAGACGVNEILGCK